MNKKITKGKNMIFDITESQTLAKTQPFYMLPTYFFYIIIYLLQYFKFVYILIVIIIFLGGGVHTVFLVTFINYWVFILLAF